MAILEDMTEQHGLAGDVDDELLALLGLKRVRVKETPSASPPREVTVEELMAELLGTQTKKPAPAEPTPPPMISAADPEYEREFAKLFGPRAREILGQDVEPLTTAEPADQLEDTSNRILQHTPDPAIQPFPGTASPAGVSVVCQPAPEHPEPAPAIPAQVPAVAPPATTSRWKQTLRIGSAVAAGGLVVLGVLAVRRRFAELRALSASEVAQVRGELKAEIDKAVVKVPIRPSHFFDPNRAKLAAFGPCPKAHILVYKPAQGDIRPSLSHW